jgi:oligogalacturonide lyase
MKAIILSIFLVSAVFAQTELPKEWIDKDTGHKITRISEENGSSSFYFHQNGYAGDKLVFQTRHGLSTYNFKTKKIEEIVEGRAGSVIVGRKTHKVFYTKGNEVFETNIDTKETRLIVKTNKLRGGAGFAVNSDETLLGGSATVGDIPSNEPRPTQSEQNAQTPAKTTPNAKPTPEQGRDSYVGKGEMMERRLAAKIPMTLYTINIKTGEIKFFHPATDWMNHVQFSPTDSTLMMFSHEGPWHKVNRTWIIRTDGSGLKAIRERLMDMEIWGHEFFSQDGKWIYYDLQTPKSEVFWLGGYEIKTGKSVKYSLTKREWSVHFNVSPNGKIFSGDGGGPNSVAKGDNGQFMYLFTPKNGKFMAEKLVNLANHDYSLEPNGTFTPDGKFIVFRSNMLGPTHIYAVEIKKSN